MSKLWYTVAEACIAFDYTLFCTPSRSIMVDISHLITFYGPISTGMNPEPKLCYRMANWTLVQHINLPAA